MALLIENQSGEIIKESKVTNIHRTKNKIDYIVYNNKGKEVKLKGDYFISSIPIKDLISITNNVDINISNNLPYREFMIVGLLVKKLKI